MALSFLLVTCVLLCFPAEPSAQSTTKVVTLEIQAPGQIGAADAVALLGRRYEEEDEDCRWATLKAMAYIGGDAAMRVVKNQGFKDEYVHARRLAEKVVQRR